MTKSFFMTKLAKNFPATKDGILADIATFIETFSEDNIGRLWDEFEASYLLASPPRKGHFINLAEKAKIYPKGKDGQYLAYVCTNCRAQRALNKPVCPRCQSRECALIPTDQPPVPESDKLASPEQIAEFEAWFKALPKRRGQDFQKVKDQGRTPEPEQPPAEKSEFEKRMEATVQKWNRPSVQAESQPVPTPKLDPVEYPVHDEPEVIDYEIDTHDQDEINMGDVF